MGLVNTTLVFCEATELALQSICNDMDSSLTTETGDVMDAMVDYKNEVYAAASGSRTDSALAVTPAGDDTAQAAALNSLQTIIDNVEEAVIGQLSNGGGGRGDSFGYPNDLRVARAALIAALYALYQAQYVLLYS